MKESASDKRKTPTSPLGDESSKTPFWPLGFLLVLLTLGVLGAIAGGIMLSVGLEDGIVVIFMGALVAAVSFISGILESS